MLHFKRFVILLASIAMLSTLSCITALAAERTDRRPNVVLIMADDFGYECVGANGGTSYKTPTLDKLAAGGLRFTHCYSQPLCTPTRVQLMTGKYNVRNYVQFGLLDPQQTTFAQLFKKAGYATCITGKWQLGRELTLPVHFGFDEYCLWQLSRRPERYKNPGLEINGKEMDYTNGEYGPDIVNAYALDFISRKKDQPFLLYYPMMLTHDPHVATPDSSDWDSPAAKKGKNKNDKGKKQAGESKQRHFADMTAYMDKLIGKLVTRLDELGLRENTLILFLGDNGTGKGVVSQMGGTSVPGGKGLANDGGMHVPLIASWPAVMKSTSVSHDLIDSTDFLPTICQAAGIHVPADLNIDGRSFLPQLQGKPGQPREWIYCWYARDGGAEASAEFARNHRYKLNRQGVLFDVSAGDHDDKPLDANKLTPEAAAARKTLQAALDQFSAARPAKLARAKSAKQ